MYPSPMLSQSTRIHSILFLVFVFASAQLHAEQFFVSPQGSDKNPGTQSQPFQTIDYARDQVRLCPGFQIRPITVYLLGGTYYLDHPLIFTPDDSGTEQAPITYRAAPNQKVIISGGISLHLKWQPWRNGIFQASTPPATACDQLFVNGIRQHMARYPNYDPDKSPYNGAAADAFSPARAARWSDPAGGFIHAMHRAHWGGYHYLITGKTPDNVVTYIGGWQNNRPMGMHKNDRFVENIFEELDAPGEWFHNPKTQTLYFYPPQGLDLSSAKIEVARLDNLLEFRGTRLHPVTHITFSGVIFRHVRRTFMLTKEPLLRSDWTIYRGGAALFNGVEDCALTDCEFDQVGGNAVFVNNYNRRLTIRACHIHGAGASGICFVGNPAAVRNPLFQYGKTLTYDQIDQTPGPRSYDYPADCLVDDTLIHNVSVVEKQAAGVQISMSSRITVRHCSIYAVGRAGINISEGTFGGHTIEFCDVFDTVRETGDHGSFNSWGRDRFWHLKNAPDDQLPDLARLDAQTTTIHNNRWRCDHGWDVDLDDGSSNYDIYNNLFLNGGLKLREGFHRRVWNNIAVNNSLHPHVWYHNSQDIVHSNIWMTRYRPAVMRIDKWGTQIDRNLFTSETDRVAYLKYGCDHNSLAGDPMFIDPARGDFRVKPESPAFKIGFKNFPMDQFGVQSPALKAIARTPEIPTLNTAASAQTAPQQIDSVDLEWIWLGAHLRGLQGSEFSAYGVSADEGGVALYQCKPNSFAARLGLAENDLIVQVNSRKITSPRQLITLLTQHPAPSLTVTFVRDQKRQTRKLTAVPYIRFESVQTPDGFARLTLPTKPAGRLFANPATHNDPLTILTDGRLTSSYGPVFSNRVTGGMYKMDLGRARTITAITSWSHHYNQKRGPQLLTLYGSKSTDDPGWNVKDNKRFIPLTTLDTTGLPAAAYNALSFHAPAGESLGTFRWIIWHVSPVTPLGENTAFQELAVE